jgi:hypothetical protein
MIPEQGGLSREFVRVEYIGPGLVLQERFHALEHRQVEVFQFLRDERERGVGRREESEEKEKRKRRVKAKCKEKRGEREDMEENEIKDKDKVKLQIEGEIARYKI